MTELLDQGEDLATAAKAAGHASVSTTARYDRRDEENVSRAVGRLASFVPYEAPRVTHPVQSTCAVVCAPVVARAARRRARWSRRVGVG